MTIFTLLICDLKHSETRSILYSKATTHWHIATGQEWSRTPNILFSTFKFRNNSCIYKIVKIAFTDTCADPFFVLETSKPGSFNPLCTPPSPTCSLQFTLWSTHFIGNREGEVKACFCPYTCNNKVYLTNKVQRGLELSISVIVMHVGIVMAI